MNPDKHSLEFLLQELIALMDGYDEAVRNNSSASVRKEIRDRMKLIQEQVTDLKKVEIRR